MTLPYYYGKAINLQLPCLNQLQPHYHSMFKLQTRAVLALRGGGGPSMPCWTACGRRRPHRHVGIVCRGGRLGDHVRELKIEAGEVDLVFCSRTFLTGRKEGANEQGRLFSERGCHGALGPRIARSWLCSS